MTPPTSHTVKKARRDLQVVLEARYFNMEKRAFQCPVPGCSCPRVLRSWAKYRAHLRYYHGLWAVRDYLR